MLIMKLQIMSNFFFFEEMFVFFIKCTLFITKIVDKLYFEY